MSTVVAKHATDARPFAGLDVSVPADTRARISSLVGVRQADWPDGASACEV